jgi:hypothetical protein
MLGRALHGEVTPIFYKGEQVGERRRYDNRLAMFILRSRMPDRYGKWYEGLQQYRDDLDGAARSTIAPCAAWRRTPPPTRSARRDRIVRRSGSRRSRPSGRATRRCRP